MQVPGDSHRIAVRMSTSCDSLKSSSRAISTNQKPTIYRNLYENTGPVARCTSWTQPHELAPELHEFWYVGSQCTLRSTIA